MKNTLKEAEHLLRLAATIVAGVVLFLVIRQAVIPANFGKFGHYRPAALDEIRARPISFAGRAACEACHGEIAEVKNKGRHAGVGCEACHGPLAKHAEDFSAVTPVKPDPAVLCARCHEADPARPKWFPQVVTKEHASNVSCGACHNPHSPKL